MEKQNKISDEEYEAILNEVTNKDYEALELEENIAVEAQFDSDKAWNAVTMQGAVLTRTNVSSAKCKRAMLKAQKERADKLRRARAAIQREALNQKEIDLNMDISNYHMQMLILNLTMQETKTISLYRNKINKYVETLLMPYIPVEVRHFSRKYKHVIKKSPGFLYTTSSANIDGKSFWVTPDIPAYFKQGDEPSIIIKNKKGYIYDLDRLISKYYEALDKLNKIEVEYASVIINNGIYTYMDLLKKKPTWYKKLYDSIIRKKQN